MILEIWVCPTEGCGNYYGSAHAGDLDTLWNFDAKGQKTFHRSRCPDCWRRDHISVDRVRVQFEYELPTNESRVT
jgi:hypothetical protein